MKMINMTAEQTQAYDADDVSVMQSLILEAQELADESGETVEIYTADGIVADARSPAAG
jgi:hypothetical protein